MATSINTSSMSEILLWFLLPTLVPTTSYHLLQLVLPPSSTTATAILQLLQPLSLPLPLPLPLPHLLVLKPQLLLLLLLLLLILLLLLLLWLLLLLLLLPLLLSLNESREKTTGSITTHLRNHFRTRCGHSYDFLIISEHITPKQSKTSFHALSLLKKNIYIYIHPQIIATLTSTWICIYIYIYIFIRIHDAI